MTESPYVNIAQKTDEVPMTAPKAEDDINFHPSFIEYLRLVYSPEEAEVVQYLNVPMAFLSTQDVAEKSGIDIESVTTLLESLHERNRLARIGDMYCLLPIQVLVNIHQFYPETEQDDLAAAQLYKEYFIKGGYYKYYETSKKGTRELRTIPVGKAIDAEQKVVSAEEAHDFILNHAPNELALAPCPCRTRTEKMGIRECKDQFPIASCIMLGPSAIHFESVGLGKRITREQAVEYFDHVNKMGLVGNTTNTIKDSLVICMCCGCCCSQLRGRTRWDNPEAILPSNFVPRAGEDCVGCGECMDRCFFDALTINDDSGKVVAQTEQCIGCGICTFACPQESLKLFRLERSTPFSTVEELHKRMTLDNKG